MSPDEIRPGVRRLFTLASERTDAAAEADAEIGFHIDARVEQLVARGMPRDAAVAEAQRRFGDVTRARDGIVRVDERRDRRRSGLLWMQELWQDVRLSLRSLRRSPTFAVVAVFCLAIGIGVNTAIFAIMHGVLIAPLQFKDSGQLVRVWRDGYAPAGVFDILAKDARSYTQLGGVDGGRWRSVRAGGEPARLVVSSATDRFFDVLGVSPLLGQTFRPGDNAPNQPRTVVLSHASWQRHFAGDTNVIGRQVQIDGIDHRVVAVMPSGFAFPSASVEAWIPSVFIPGSASYWWETYFMVVGRLAPRTTVAGAQAEARVLFDRARAAFPMRMPDGWGKDVEVMPLKESLVGNVRSTLFFLLAAAGVVLVIAVVNVATLVAGRTGSRLKELAVRSALGAARGRLVRLLLAESLVIALVAATLGVMLAFVTLDGLRAVLPAETPRVQDIRIDTGVLLAVTAVAVVCAFGIGLVPALLASRPALADTLRSDERTGGTRRARRSSSVLAGVQVALAVVLVTSAALLLESLRRLQQVDLGFTPTGAVAASIPIPAFPNDTASRTIGFVEQLLHRVRAQPNVGNAGIASALPFGDGITTAAMEIEDKPTPPGDVPPLPQLTLVTPAFLETLRIPLLSGRGITDADRAGSMAVGVIDDVAARTYWPGQDPIGRRIRYVWNKQWITIVGVTRSIKRDSLNAAAAPSLYLPITQGRVGELRIVVRTAAPLRDAARDIRAAVRAIDANVPVGEVRPLDVIVNGSAARARFIALLVSAFGLVALLLGAIGIYGVSSAAVTQRRRELGVRLALGATAPQLLGMVLRQNVIVAATGGVAGLVLAIAAGRAMASLLFGVTPLDVSVLLTVTVLLMVVTVLSALGPAVRASRVDPIIAVREAQ